MSIHMLFTIRLSYFMNENPLLHPLALRLEFNSYIHFVVELRKRPLLILSQCPLGYSW